MILTGTVAAVLLHLSDGFHSDAVAYIIVVLIGIYAFGLVSSWLYVTGIRKEVLSTPNTNIGGGGGLIITILGSCLGIL